MSATDKLNDTCCPCAVSPEEIEVGAQASNEWDDEVMDEDNAKYVLTEWGCLSCVLRDYGFDISRISGKVGQHIVEDFMELMCTAGYIKENSELKEENCSEGEH